MRLCHVTHDTWEREATPVGLVTRGVKSTAPMLRSYAPLTTKEICHNLDLLTTLALTSLLENINLGQTPS